MATVETVAGPLDLDELGTTLVHGHLRTALRRGRHVRDEQLGEMMVENPRRWLGS